MENKIVILPEEVIEDINLSRQKCDVIVEKVGSTPTVWCDDDRTTRGCRGSDENPGCELRDTGLYPQYGIRVSQLSESFQIK